MLFKKNKAIVYIDGFNLYYGLKKAIRNGYNKKCKWLNVVEFSKDIIPPGYKLVKTKYFSSRISGDPAATIRQNTFLDAISTLPDIELYYGVFQHNQQYCNHCKSELICSKCGNKYFKYNEKRTDVNIATEMLLDAYKGDFDAAMLVSADSDLIGPISGIKGYFKNKKVFAGFPPYRSSKSIKQLVDSHRKIRENVFIRNILPDPYTTPDGVQLTCPVEWK